MSHPPLSSDSQQQQQQQVYSQPAAAAQPPQPAGTNTLAIVALISSFFISLAGVICGHIALGQIKQTGEQGRGMALAGLIIGYVGLVSGLIFFAFLFLIVGIGTAV